VDCRCKSCGRRFARRPQNPDQKYCHRKACQNERRRRWRRQKLTCDPNYRANVTDSQKRWSQNHADYWRDYRARHPQYVEANRSRQKARDRLRADLAAVTRTGAVLAKSDACTPESDSITVYYELLPAQPADLAKRYASRRIFQLIPVGYNDLRTDSQSCKDTTRGTLAEKSIIPGPCPGPSP